MGLWQACAIGFCGRRCPFKSASFVVPLRHGTWFPVIWVAWIMVEEQAVTKRQSMGFVLVKFHRFYSPRHHHIVLGAKQRLVGGPALSRSCRICVSIVAIAVAQAGLGFQHTCSSGAGLFPARLSWFHSWTMVRIKAMCNAGDTCQPSPQGPNDPAVAGDW